MESETTEALQKPVSSPQKFDWRMHHKLLMHLMDANDKNMEAKIKALEKEEKDREEAEEKLKQEIKAREKMEEMLQCKLGRINALANELLARGSVEMGANRDVVKSYPDSDPVTRLETELHRFFSIEAVTQGELQTSVNPDSKSGQGQQCRDSIITNRHTLQPEPSTSAASNVTREPPKKRKIESTSPSSVGSDVVVNEEPGIHRRKAKNFLCTCLQQFKTESGLLSHIIFYFNKDVVCPFKNGGIDCGENFFSTVELSRHARLRHGMRETLRQCRYCRASIKIRNEGLKKHRLEVHNFELTDDDGIDVELAPDARDAINHQQSNDLATGDMETNNEEQFAEEDMLLEDDSAE